MPARSLTIIKDEQGAEICVLLREAGGDPAFHGFDLKRFLSCFVVTQAVEAQSLMDRKRKFAKGMHCLAAQVIAHFKTGIGSFYLYPAGTRTLGEAYRYTVFYDAEGLKLEVEAYGGGWHLLFQGLVEWFDPDHAGETWREHSSRPQAAESVPTATSQTGDEADKPLAATDDETDDWWTTALGDSETESS